MFAVMRATACGVHFFQRAARQTDQHRMRPDLYSETSRLFRNSCPSIVVIHRKILIKSSSVMTAQIAVSWMRMSALRRARGGSESVPHENDHGPENTMKNARVGSQPPLPLISAPILSSKSLLDLT